MILLSIFRVKSQGQISNKVILNLSYLILFTYLLFPFIDFGPCVVCPSRVATVLFVYVVTVVAVAVRRVKLLRRSDHRKWHIRHHHTEV